MGSNAVNLGIGAASGMFFHAPRMASPGITAGPPSR